jgi:N-acetylglucosamine kinase-like BadF-type ATPase
MARQCNLFPGICVVSRERPRPSGTALINLPLDNLPHTEVANMAFFLGIDGGASKTACVVGDERSVLGRGLGGSCNLTRVSEAEARESLAAAIQQACAQSQITPAQITRTCVGAAGAARPEVSQVVRRVVSGLVPGEVEVVGDMVIALEAAFGGGPGVLVIAGTGSIAYGVNAEGQTARAGGWGFAISDEGSGQWIGRAAVGAVFRAQDEGRDPPLLREMMMALGVESLGQLVLAANATPAPDFSTLFPVVLAMAKAGDSAALGVLTAAGHELAGMAKTVIRRLFAGEKNVRVAMSGGVFTNSSRVREVFYNDLGAEISGVEVLPTVVEPMLGALALARKATG